MDTSVIILCVAFLCGFVVSRLGLPPLIGFLVAGFVLHGVGIESTPVVAHLAELGVTLLLFTIGLKLHLRSLFSPPFFGSASIHLGLNLAVFALLLIILAAIGTPLFVDLKLPEVGILAFALSFSSTVFAIKTLQEKGEISALYGQLAIAILVVQDIFAVLYLAISTGKVPSIWALALLALPLAKPLLTRMLDRVGHGELLVLYGLVLALTVGSGLFTLVGLKGDLGALIVGALLAGSKKAEELSKSLLALKDLFLVGFFLQIGLEQLPSTHDIWLALLLVALLPLKTLLYYLAIALFKFRVRTTLYTSFTLTNYSEFGLIVLAIAAQTGSMSGQWLTIMALALSLSFLLATPINQSMGTLYQWLRPHMEWAHPVRLNMLDTNIRFGQAQFLVVGMGRIGTGVYDYLAAQFGNDAVFGIDSDTTRVDHHRRKTRNVVHANATDNDFWIKAELSSQLTTVFLAMPEHRGNFYAASYLRGQNFSGHVAAMVRYQDEGEELQALGINIVFNLYREAGAGFARDVCQDLNLLTTVEMEKEQGKS